MLNMRMFNNTGASTYALVGDLENAMNCDSG